MFRGIFLQLMEVTAQRDCGHLPSRPMLQIHVRWIENLAELMHELLYLLNINTGLFFTQHRAKIAVESGN